MGPLNETYTTSQNAKSTRHIPYSEYDTNPLRETKRNKERKIEKERNIDPERYKDTRLSLTTNKGFRLGLDPINLEEPVRVASPTRKNSPGGTRQGGQPT